MTNPAVTQSRLIATPSRLAQHLAPKVWGPGSVFRVDPWIRKVETEALDAINDRVNQRFIKTNAPSQVGKTFYEEVFLPFWVLGMYPETRIILVGYSDAIANRSGAWVRDLVKGFGAELFDIDVDPQYESRGDWKLLDHQGGMLSVGIGSGITGRSGDLVIIGDVIKNMEEASSATTKQWHWNEWEGTISPRLQPAATCLLGATRFSDDDLSGRFDAQMAEPGYDGPQWVSLVFPAIAEPRDDEDGDDPEWRDVIGRRRGEPLTCRYSKPGDEKPENWANSYFYRLRAGKGPYVWSAVYQQEPTSPTGSMFPPGKWGWYDPSDLPPIFSQRRVWDLAATEGAGDWSVGTHIARVEHDQFDFIIRDVQRFQKSGADAKKEVETIAKSDGVACPIMIERERSGAGKSILEFYSLAMPNHTVQPAIPDGKKLERAKPYSTLQQSGKVALPRDPETKESPDWVQGFIDEHKKLMPDGRRGRYDDQIDTAAYGVNDMLDATPTEIEEPDMVLTSSGDLIGVGGYEIG